MEIRVLKYFLAVTQEKNMNKAAQLLHISQPTISRQLKALEDELGTQLFIRGNREITLTEDGKYLVDKAKQIITLSDQAELNIGNEPSSISGRVIIGCNETPSVKYLAEATKKINNDYPNILIDVVSTNADTIKKSLDNGIFDFGIILSPTDNKNYSFLNLPGNQEWGLFIPKNDDLAKKESINKNDLLASNLIISRQPEFTNTLNKWIGSNQEKLKVTALYDLLYNALLFVESGVGYALGVGRTINTIGTDLVFRPLYPHLKSSSSLIWLKNVNMSSVAKVVLKQMYDEVETNK
ncbi:LysR family transcriptional regulator [Companilactobacillus pabuli]|uniref:LysR family transcriptional regulator n=1 Tax=Companilactobacillus pabuli TaxID=2714036 RepID=UPI0035168A8E